MVSFQTMAPPYMRACAKLPDWRLRTASRFCWRRRRWIIGENEGGPGGVLFHPSLVPILLSVSQNELRPEPISSVYPTGRSPQLTSTSRRQVETTEEGREGGHSAPLRSLIRSPVAEQRIQPLSAGRPRLTSVRAAIPIPVPMVFFPRVVGEGSVTPGLGPSNNAISTASSNSGPALLILGSLGRHAIQGRYYGRRWRGGVIVIAN